MIVALLLLLIVVGSLLFHILSPWQFGEIASNWYMIDVTVYITFWICGIVFVVLGVFMAWAVWKYEFREGQKAQYEPENALLESRLSIITTIGVVIMLAPGLIVWQEYIEVPPDATELEVYGQQWQWSFRLAGEDGIFGAAHNKYITFDNPMGMKPGDPYGEDDVLIRTASIKLPINRKVKVLLRSKDVLHDFWVPEIRAKMDAVPGMITYFWFEPTKLGEYEILCAELCGRGHHTMRGVMDVVSLEQYGTWLETQLTWSEIKAGVKPLSPEVIRGRQVAESNGCFACHTLDGSETVGPTWQGLWGRVVTMTDDSTQVVDEAYVRESITDPNVRIRQGFSPVMIPYELAEEDMADLILFLKNTAEEDAAESDPVVEES